jgi:hypothetical protein
MDDFEEDGTVPVLPLVRLGRRVDTVGERCMSRKRNPERGMFVVIWKTIVPPLSIDKNTHPCFRRFRMIPNENHPRSLL